MNIKDIEFIERKLKIVLPQFYINFMLNYPHDQYKEVAGNSIIYDSAEIIQLNKKAYHDLWDKPLSKEYFVIGENGCGDSYIIGLNGEQTIIMFNHEDQCFYSIANSFEEYVDRLINDTTEENLENELFLIKELRYGSYDENNLSFWQKIRNWFE